MQLHSLYCIVFAAIYYFSPSCAYPVERQKVLRVQPTGAVACDPISIYTTEWFLASTLPEHRKEVHEKALFYTRGTSQTARDLAVHSQGQYITIWEVWPCWLYNDSIEEDNKLRCIHHNPEARRTFYENMSRAFARMARKSVTVMHSTSDFAQPPEDGIWARVELPTLREKTDIKSIRKINTSGSMSRSTAVARELLSNISVLIQNAIDEVRAIFRQARIKADDSTSAACSIWSSVGDQYLDSLW